MTKQELIKAAKLIKENCKSFNGKCNEACPFNENWAWCELVGSIDDCIITPDDWDIERLERESNDS